jgi:carbon storage regulator
LRAFALFKAEVPSEWFRCDLQGRVKLCFYASKEDLGMLVLSRMKGQQVVVGGTITVTVLEVRGDKVKLGFDGPAEIPIHRQEVFERLTQETDGQDGLANHDARLSTSLV